MNTRLPKYVLGLAFAAAILSILPFLYGLSQTPAGSRYVGHQYNLDDHMVYAAWMRQAMEGRFFFDNRFAVDPQPSLTVHIYFFALGLVAKVTGIPWAAALARFVFAGLFVVLLYRFLSLITSKPRWILGTMWITTFGAGVGFLFWEMFGVTIQHSALKGAFGSILAGLVPTDVVQPEGFVFSSLLTNSLFSFSLCVILGILICVIRSRDSWKPVFPGFLLFAVLMNAHSYDILLITLVLVAFLGMQVMQRDIPPIWVGRVALMGLGAVGPALWFMHVLKEDAVFRARADTLTYTGDFRPLLFGYILFLLVAGGAFLAMWRRGVINSTRQIAGGGLLALLLLGMFLMAAEPPKALWMDQATWILAFVIALIAAALLATRKPALNILIAWASVGFVAPYFPALFQRKLTMGLAVPWGVLAGLGLCWLLQLASQKDRRMLGALAALLFSVTSIKWFLREFQYINLNVSNTTLHAIYLPGGTPTIFDYLSEHHGTHTVIFAMPGVAIKDQTPYMPDLNPILSGWTGVYSYAGHWSETPDYVRRRNLVTKFFTRMTREEQAATVKQYEVAYIVAPIPDKFPELEKIGLSDVSGLGKVVAQADKFQLIEISR